MKVGPSQWSKIRFNKDIEEGLKQYVPSYNLIKKNSWCNYHIGLDCSQPQALSRSVELFPLLQPPTQFYLFWLNLSSASHSLYHLKFMKVKVIFVILFLWNISFTSCWCSFSLSWIKPWPSSSSTSKCNAQVIIYVEKRCIVICILISKNSIIDGGSTTL